MKSCNYMIKNKNKNNAKLHYLCIIELLYKFNGVNGLSNKWLCDNYHKPLYNRIVITYKTTLESLSIDFNCHDEWKNNRKAKLLHGRNCIIWSETVFTEKCKEIVSKYGYFPPSLFLVNNGYSELISYFYSHDYTYEKINKLLNIDYCPIFTSRNGLKFRSLAEACLANFLYARGIEIKVGEKYPEGYSVLSGKKYGVYDIHFKGKKGEYTDKWIDCEVWGENPNGHNKENYAITRKYKESFNKDNDCFIGIAYHDCYRENELSTILNKYIGTIEPYIFNNEEDKQIKPTLWNSMDVVKKQCRHIMENNNNIIPTEGWMRKRGKYKNRPTEEWENKYNLASLTVYIKQVGGIRKIRELLGNSEKSTNTWDKDKIILYIKNIYETYKKTPGSLSWELKIKKNKDDNEIKLKNEIVSMTSACSLYFDGKYREACEVSGVPVRKLKK